jgi:hypothetical protein
MRYLVFFEDIAGQDCAQQENSKVEYLHHPPITGDRISLGTRRLWHIVGVDRYQNPENPEDIIYLAHCTVDKEQIESVDRSNWFRIKAYQGRNPNLQLFLSEGILLQVNENLTGQKPKTGYLLPKYNVKEHTVTSQPWGTVSVTSYFPSSDIDMTCYNAVHICQCDCVPEVVRSDYSHQLVNLI